MENTTDVITADVSSKKIVSRNINRRGCVALDSSSRHQKSLVD